MKALNLLDDSNRNAASDATERTFQAAKAAITPYINAGKFKNFEGNIQLTLGIRAETLFGHTPNYTMVTPGDMTVVRSFFIRLISFAIYNTPVSR